MNYAEQIVAKSNEIIYNAISCRETQNITYFW